MNRTLAALTSLAALALAGAAVPPASAQTASAKSAAQTAASPEKRAAFAWVDENRGMLAAMTDRVWEFAELPMEEYRSSRLLADALEKEGFAVERGVAGMPTAFVATYGSGDPVLGFLAEYRRAARPLAEVRAEAGPARGRRVGPRLRAQPAGRGGRGRRHGRQARDGPVPPEGDHQAVRRAERGERHRQGLHGQGRAVHRAVGGGGLAPGRLDGGVARRQPRHPQLHRQLPWEDGARRRRPVGRPKRAGRRGSDERDGELPARARAARRCASSTRSPKGARWPTWSPITPWPGTTAAT